MTQLTSPVMEFLDVVLSAISTTTEYNLVPNLDKTAHGLLSFGHVNDFYSQSSPGRVHCHDRHHCFIQTLDFVAIRDLVTHSSEGRLAGDHLALSPDLLKYH